VDFANVAAGFFVMADVEVVMPFLRRRFMRAPLSSSALL